MGNDTGHNSITATWAKVLLRCALFVVPTVLLALLFLKIYLNTSLAASQLSRFLSDYAHQPVRVAGIGTSGGVLHLKGVSLANPPGFPAGDLVAVDALTIAPAWPDLLSGRRSLRLVALDRIRIDLCQNSSGVWNFAALQKRFAAGKPAAYEMLIRQLSVKDGSIKVNGRQVEGIALTVRDLATKGSADSRIDLAFEDEGRNRYFMTGKARLGNDPVLDVSLSAPSISLKSLAGGGKGKTGLLPRDGNARLLISANVSAGVLKARGRLDFSRMVIGTIRPSLGGNLSVALEYDQRNDRVLLEGMSLAVNDSLRARIQGTIEGLRQKRAFVFTGTLDKADLGAFAAFLPEGERRRTSLGGTISGMRFRLSGTGASGVTAATGGMVLRGGRLSRDGLLLVNGLDGTVTLSNVAGGFGVHGRLEVGRAREKAVLEALDAPFSLSLNSRMKPVKAVVPALSARVMGIPLTARFGFTAAATVPFSGSLRIPSTAVATLNPLLKRMDLALATGRASLSLEATGRGPDSFSAAARAELAKVRGNRGSTPFALDNGMVVSRVTRDKRHAGLTGSASFNGVGLNRMTGDARFDYRVADDLVVLENARLRLDDVSMALARLTARIPAKATVPGMVRYPLSVEVAGCDVSRGQVALNGLSGALKADYVTGRGARWLEGGGEITSGPVSWQRKPVGSAVARVSFSRLGATLDFSGAVLGSAVRGTASANPFAVNDGGTFRVAAQGARLAAVTDLLGKKGAVAFSEGVLDAAANGAYSEAKGIDCRFDATGRDVALVGSGGKTLVSGAGIRLNGSMSGRNVTVGEAAVTVGQGVSLKANGTVDNALSARRQGRIAFAVSRTPVAAIVDPFVNILPRLIQEATVDGAVAVEGAVDLHGGKQLLEGAVTLEHVRLDAPSQKFSVADITGRLPFSFDLSGVTIPRDAAAASFTRPNYPRVLERFREAAAGPPSITVAKTVFGPLELGRLAMHVKAGNGITGITSLSSSLYGGELLGNGVVSVKNGLWYRGDLLVNGLSLKRLCSVFPGIEGYISGSIDGLVSVQESGGGVTKLFGFADLWAKETSGEKMLVSKEFLQRLSGKKLSGFFFSSDRPYDRAEITASMENGYLTFDNLAILHTNVIGVRDLSVTIVPSQNRISLDHLITSVKEAATRGKAATGGESPESPPATEFKWQE